MNSYKSIPIWENKRRLKLLNEFKELIGTYFENSRYSWQAEGRIEEQLARTVREPISKRIDQIRSIAIRAGVYPVKQWTPPPTVGGDVKDIDVLLDVFNLHSYNITDDDILVCLDRAIGVYEFDQLKCWFRTLNPFFWLHRALLWIARLPLRFLGEIGFNTKKAEETT